MWFFFSQKKRKRTNRRSDNIQNELWETVLVTSGERTCIGKQLIDILAVSVSPLQSRSETCSTMNSSCNLLPDKKVPLPKRGVEKCNPVLIVMNQTCHRMVQKLTVFKYHSPWEMLSETTKSPNSAYKTSTLHTCTLSTGPVL